MDKQVIEKDAILALMASGRSVLAFHMLQVHFDEWCSAEYHYKGAELCDTLISHMVNTGFVLEYNEVDTLRQRFRAAESAWKRSKL